MNVTRIEWGMATSACVLGTILVMMCLLQPMDSIARAGDSVGPAANGIGVMTLANGEGPDHRPSECVYLLDNRNESLMIYSVEMAGNNRTLALRSVENLPNLFRAARPR
ncbi:MAG: hypothetical protein EBY29_17115 [Planctomycetes bacterium]|nr:hypothetical protein [Planctomycetota bacterium]